MRRIDQWLANLGYCSRSEAKAWVKEGRVLVGGTPAKDYGQKVDATQVMVDREPLDHPDGLLLLYHKPVGLTCSHDPREAPLIYDALPERWKRRNPGLTSVGRLDKDTSGLLLLTDLPDLVHQLTAPKKELPKVYEATVDREIPESAISLFQSGTLQLEGEAKPCLPATLRLTGPKQAQVVLTEGKYHQVRRMFGALGITVETLHRSHFGFLSLETLPAGSWKSLPLNCFDPLTR